MALNFELNQVKLGIVGLGYVGLPLAVEFGKHYPTIGYDISQSRIDELRPGRDSSLEVEPEELRAVQGLGYTDNAEDLAGCNVFIVTVPTPIDVHKAPDLRPLESASRTLGGVMQPGSIVIYESTVYPGATEEVCIPIIEQVSGLTFNRDFFAGYSPERINPRRQGAPPADDQEGDIGLHPRGCRISSMPFTAASSLPGPTRRAVSASRRRPR